MNNWSQIFITKFSNNKRNFKNWVGSKWQDIAQDKINNPKLEPTVKRPSIGPQPQQTQQPEPQPVQKPQVQPKPQPKQNNNPELPPDEEEDLTNNL